MLDNQVSNKHDDHVTIYIGILNILMTLKLVERSKVLVTVLFIGFACFAIGYSIGYTHFNI